MSNPENRISFQSLELNLINKIIPLVMNSSTSTQQLTRLGRASARTPRSPWPSEP